MIFDLKNDDLLLQNDDFLLKNVDFHLKYSRRHELP